MSALFVAGIGENSIRGARHNPIHDKVWTSTDSWHESTTNRDGCASYGGIRRRNRSIGDRSQGTEAPEDTSYRKKVEFCFLLKHPGNRHGNCLFRCQYFMVFHLFVFLDEKNALTFSFFFLSWFIASEDVNHLLHLHFVGFDIKESLFCFTRRPVCS